MDIQETFHQQQEYLEKESSSLDLSRRTELLKKLLETIEAREKDIAQALQMDLKKCDFEAYVAEIDYVKSNIRYTLKHLKKWLKPKKVSTPLVHWPAKSFVYPEALGKVLIISPWNYPFQLLISPLVGAIAAGNTCILKPSEVAIHTSHLVAKIFAETFDPKEVAVIEGGIPETTELLELPFDHIFYTGNSHVGRIVMEKASKNLTPVTLELGGKSPCVVSSSSDLEVAAKRIVWGKFFNAGQTCVAPDYLLIEKDIKDSFMKLLKETIEDFFGRNPQQSPDFGRIINEKHFERLNSLFTSQQVIYGGVSEKSELYIAPTLIHASEDSPVMKEEIFGPLFPIFEFEHFDEALRFIKKREKPLAAYLFTQNESEREKFLEKISAGGVCLNDVVIHLSVEELPFGGVGESGMGSYHGYKSFETFSHQKSVLKRKFVFDNSLRYPPYKGKLSLLRKLLRFIG